MEPHAVQGDASTEESAGGDQSQAAAYNEETGEINWDCPVRLCSQCNALQGHSRDDATRAEAVAAVLAPRPSSRLFPRSLTDPVPTHYLLLLRSRSTCSYASHQCLGGMAHGPCGPQFREAFSCFVHSEEEPKGVDCVEKFKNMQDCFRQHPELYGESGFRCPLFCLGSDLLTVSSCVLVPAQPTSRTMSRSRLSLALRSRPSKRVPLMATTSSSKLYTLRSRTRRRNPSEDYPEEGWGLPARASANVGLKEQIMSLELVLMPSIQGC